MDYVRNIEDLVSLLVTVFEMQVQTVKLVNRQRMPMALVEHTKMLATTLLRVLDTIEQRFVDDIEKEGEGVLGSFAGITAMLQSAGKEADSESAELFMHLSQMSREGHRSLTSALSEEEIRVTSDITARFKKMKDKVTGLIAKMEAI